MWLARCCHSIGTSTMVWLNAGLMYCLQGPRIKAIHGNVSSRLYECVRREGAYIDTPISTFYITCMPRKSKAAVNFTPRITSVFQFRSIPFWFQNNRECLQAVLTARMMRCIVWTSITTRKRDPVSHKLRPRAA